MHQGGTWSIPGGARERGETAVQAAVREVHEEVGIAADTLSIRGSHVATCGGWDYTTVLAAPVGVVRLGNHGHHLAEADDHAWLSPDEVDLLPLHPSFGRAWLGDSSQLRAFVRAS